MIPGEDLGRCPVCGTVPTGHNMVGDADKGTFGGYRLKPCRHVVRGIVWPGIPDWRPGEPTTGRRPPPVYILPGESMTEARARYDASSPTGQQSLF